jgi:hypothetical protein
MISTEEVMMRLNANMHRQIKLGTQSKDTRSEKKGHNLFHQVAASNQREDLVKRNFQSSPKEKHAEEADEFVTAAGRDGIIHLSKTPDGQYALRVVYKHASNPSREFMESVQHEQGLTAIDYTGRQQAAQTSSNIQINERFISTAPLIHSKNIAKPSGAEANQSNQSQQVSTSRSVQSGTTNSQQTPIVLSKALMKTAQKYIAPLQQYISQAERTAHNNNPTQLISPGYRKFLNLLRAANDVPKQNITIDQRRFAFQDGVVQTSDLQNIGSSTNASSTNSPTASTTWQVDHENNTIYLDNGYKIVLDGEECSWKLYDAGGNVLHVWGDPHVSESDGGRWDFKADMTFELDDGTKITVQTKDWGNGMTVSDNLIITNGDQCVQVSGIADNNPVISEVTTDGEIVDANTDDGYLASEMEGVDDWEWAGDEITHNMPFVDHSTYEHGMGYQDISTVLATT